LAYYYASTNADYYAPGAPITLTLSSSGDLYTRNGRVAVGVYGGGIGSCTWAPSVTGTVWAPTTPGWFPISLLGVWNDCGGNAYNAYSSIWLQVVCPSGTVSNGSSCVSVPPSVNINFSFLDKVVKFINGTV
jgi:hypothetical protein